MALLTWTKRMLLEHPSLHLVPVSTTSTSDTYLGVMVDFAVLCGHMTVAEPVLPVVIK